MPDPNNKPPDGCPETPLRSPWLAESTVVQLTQEKNQVGLMGCISILFPPGAVDAAMEKAVQWADAVASTHDLPTADAIELEAAACEGW